MLYVSMTFWLVLVKCQKYSMFAVKIYIQEKTKTILNTKKSYFVSRRTFNVTVDIICMMSSVRNVKKCQPSNVTMSINL